MPQFGWFVDLRRCVGCHACSIACKAEQNTAPVLSPLTVRHGRAVGVNYRQVVTVDQGTYPAVTRTFVTMACNHCESPACLLSCPVAAISKDTVTGLVQIDQSACIGCRYCQWACPYGAPQFNEETRKVEKCTGCVHRVSAGLEPACVTSCPSRALTFTTDWAPTPSVPPDGFADASLTNPSITFRR